MKIFNYNKYHSRCRTIPGIIVGSLYCKYHCPYRLFYNGNIIYHTLKMKKEKYFIICKNDIMQEEFEFLGIKGDKYGKRIIYKGNYEVPV